MSECLATFSMKGEVKHPLQGRSWGQGGGASGERRKGDAIIVERGKENAQRSILGFLSSVSTC